MYLAVTLVSSTREVEALLTVWLFLEARVALLVGGDARSALENLEKVFPFVFPLVSLAPGLAIRVARGLARTMFVAATRFK